MANYASAQRSHVFPYISVSGSAELHARCAGGKITSHPISFPEPTCLLVSTKTPCLGRYVYTGIQSYGVPLRSKYPNSEMLFQKQNISRDVQNMMPKIIIYRSRPKKKYVHRVPVYLTKYSIMRFSMGK